MESTSEISAGVGPGTALPPRARSVPAQRRRSEARPVPVLREAYAHLSLEALRDYRQALTDEENKVSYWRRLLHGRLDVIGEGGGDGGGRTAPVAHARLGTMLTQERISSGRQALAAVVPSHDIPPLPRLGQLWERQLAAGDDAARDALVHDLRAAEEQLSTYRSALHVRLAEATEELIARYRAEPTLCLSVLPQERSAARA